MLPKIVVGRCKGSTDNNISTTKHCCQGFQQQKLLSSFNLSYSQLQENLSYNQLQENLSYNQLQENNNYNQLQVRLDTDLTTF